MSPRTLKLCAAYAAMKIDRHIIAAAMTRTAIAWCSYPLPQDLCATPETPFGVFLNFFLSFFFRGKIFFRAFFVLSLPLAEQDEKNAPSNAAEIDPRVTDMFIQCKNVLSLAKKALASVRRSVAMSSPLQKSVEEVERRKKRDLKKVFSKCRTSTSR